MCRSSKFCELFKINQLTFQIVKLSDAYPIGTELLNIEGSFYAYLNSRFTKINLQSVAQQLKLEMQIDEVNTFDTISIYDGKFMNSHQIKGIHQYLCPQDMHLMNILKDVRVNLELSNNIIKQIDLLPILLNDQPNQINRTKRSLLQSLLFDSSNEIQELKQKLHTFGEIANSNIVRENKLFRMLNNNITTIERLEAHIGNINVYNQYKIQINNIRQNFLGQFNYLLKNMKQTLENVQSTLYFIDMIKLAILQKQKLICSKHLRFIAKTNCLNLENLIIKNNYDLLQITGHNVNLQMSKQKLITCELYVNNSIVYIGSQHLSYVNYSTENNNKKLEFRLVKESDIFVKTDEFYAILILKDNTTGLSCNNNILLYVNAIPLLCTPQVTKFFNFTILTLQTKTNGTNLILLRNAKNLTNTQIKFRDHLSLNLIIDDGRSNTKLNSKIDSLKNIPNFIFKHVSSPSILLYLIMTIFAIMMLVSCILVCTFFKQVKVCCQDLCNMIPCICWSKCKSSTINAETIYKTAEE